MVGVAWWWVWSFQRPSYTCVILIHLKTPSVCTSDSKFVKYQSFTHHFLWTLESFDSFHPSGFYQPKVASITLIPVGSPLCSNLMVRGHKTGPVTVRFQVWAVAQRSDGRGRERRGCFCAPAKTKQTLTGSHA